MHKCRFELFHPKRRRPHRSSKSMGTSPFVKISANWSLVPIFLTMIPPEKYCLNQWYLMAMCFDLVGILGDSIFAKNIRAPALFFQIVVCMDMTSSFITLSVEATSFSNSRSEIGTRHAVLIAIYSTSVIELAILLLSFLLQIMGDPPTQIT